MFRSQLCFSRLTLLCLHIYYYINCLDKIRLRRLDSIIDNVSSIKVLVLHDDDVNEYDEDDDGFAIVKLVLLLVSKVDSVASSGSSCLLPYGNLNIS